MSKQEICLESELPTDSEFQSRVLRDKPQPATSSVCADYHCKVNPSFPTLSGDGERVRRSHA